MKTNVRKVFKQTNGQSSSHPLHPQWKSINWKAVESNVESLQRRIYRATELQQWKKVKSLQKLLIRSTSNKLLAIRRVTLENKGHNTAGVDNIKINTPQERIDLVGNLRFKGYKPKPLRREYIPKRDGKLRPLGIATIKDRVMQAILKTAIEPEWEAKFEPNSYGFRPKRTCQDAIGQCFRCLCSKYRSQWILDADIKGAFDNVSHEGLLDRITGFKKPIERWLKAGHLEKGIYWDTESGTPQGAIVSPLLCNIALHGMEGLFVGDRGINVIRYSDDFIITAKSKEQIESYVIPKVGQHLAQMGLRLNEEKSRIVHISEGFDFLGFNIREYGKSTKNNRRLIIKPAKEKVIDFLRRIKEEIRRRRTSPQPKLIAELNLMIRGWGNYYRYVVSKETFNYVLYRLWKMLWQWARRRHPNKCHKWITSKYWKSIGERKWVFTDGTYQLFNLTAMKIKRHVKIKGKASPYNAKLKDYFAKRESNYLREQEDKAVHREVLTRQGYKCIECGVALKVEDKIQYHHIIQKKYGGTDLSQNLRALHYICHLQYHQIHGK